MPKIKRTLYVGLGGTGAKILLKIKKNFIESYGQVPPMIGFLVIDTDRAILKVSESTNRGQKVLMDNSEMLCCTALHAQAIYQTNKKMNDWVPGENVNSLSLIMGNGAGSVRSNGRFIAYYNNKVIIDRVQDSVTKIHQIPNVNSNFVLDSPSGVAPSTTVNVIGSVAGGSGSGLLLDTLCLVRTAIDRTGVIYSVYPWIILPDIFRTITSGPAMSNVYPNSYGALRELDYIQHHSLTKNPIDFGHSKIEGPLFEYAFIINNKNLTGATITDPEDLWESVANSAFLPASDMGNDISSTFDNIVNVQTIGAYNIKDKRAWAASSGNAELVYDSKKVGLGYAYKITESLCSYLTGNPKADPNKLANDFIDHPNVMIRENNGRDDIIDSLLTPTSLTFSIDRYTQPADLLTYINSYKGKNFEDTLNKNLKNKLGNTGAKFQNFISDIMQDNEGCVTLAINVIHSMKGVINDCRKEMREEASNYGNTNNKTIDWREKLLACEAKGLARLAGKYDSERIEELQKEIFDCGTNILEEKRRLWAITFYDDFEKLLNDYDTNLNALKDNIASIQRDSLADLATLQNKSSAPSPFKIHLHEKDLRNVSFTLNNGDVALFKKQVGKISSLMNYNMLMLSQVLFSYAKQHVMVTNAENSSIDTVLRTMNKKELTDVLRRLISLAEPLWIPNTMGYKGTALNLDKFLVIGVNQKGASFLENITDPSIKDIFTLPGHITTYVTTQRTDRISVLMVEDLLPIYAVSNVPVYKKENDFREINQRGNLVVSHLDSNLDARIRSERFSIFPSGEKDSTLKHWVFGFIFGLIYYDANKGQYWVRSLDKGDALQNYRFNLGSQRDVAYDCFRSMSIDSEIQKCLDDLIDQDGISGYREKILNAQKDNYISNFSQISDKEWNQRELPAFKRVKQLLTDEMNFITRFKVSDAVK